MPAAKTKKKTSTKAGTAKKKKTPTAKKTTSVHAKKSSPAKKSSSVKKTSRVKSSAKKVPVKTTLSKPSKKMTSDASMFILSLRDADGPKEPVSARGVTDELPVIDLEHMHEAQEPEVVEVVHTHSRVAFYLGVFLGAVVVNALIVTILASLSI